MKNEALLGSEQPLQGSYGVALDFLPMLTVKFLPLYTFRVGSRSQFVVWLEDGNPEGCGHTEGHTAKGKDPEAGLIAVYSERAAWRGCGPRLILQARQIRMWKVLCAESRGITTSSQITPQHPSSRPRGNQGATGAWAVQKPQTAVLLPQLTC